MTQHYFLSHCFSRSFAKFVSWTCHILSNKKFGKTLCRFWRHIFRSFPGHSLQRLPQSSLADGWRQFLLPKCRYGGRWSLLTSFGGHRDQTALQHVYVSRQPWHEADFPRCQVIFVWREREKTVTISLSPSLDWQCLFNCVARTFFAWSTHKLLLYWHKNQIIEMQS